MHLREVAREEDIKIVGKETIQGFPGVSSGKDVQCSESHTQLCDLMVYTVQGILQARILQWAAFPFSRGSSQPRDRTKVSPSY